MDNAAKWPSGTPGSHFAAYSGGSPLQSEFSCSEEAARRALVAQVGLLREQPGSIEETVQRIGCVQMDPMQVVAPAHLLTLRLRRAHTSEALLSRALGRGALVEARVKERCIVSSRDLAAAAPQFLHFRSRSILSGRGLAEVGQQVLSELRARGPLLAREFQSEQRVKSFWDEDESSMKATTMALEILALEGSVIVVGRSRGERRYALPETIFPGWDEALRDAERAGREAAGHYARTMGIFRLNDPYLGWRPRDVAAKRRSIAAAMLESGEWVRLKIGEKSGYACAREFMELLGAGEPVRGVRVLAPLDNLLWDRTRLEDLFGFYYRWEAYTPAAKRTVGPYGMPVLLDGSLIGEVDARLVRGEGLRTRLIPRVRLTNVQERRIERHLSALARDLGSKLWPEGARSAD